MGQAMKIKNWIGIVLGTIALLLSIKSICQQNLVVVDVKRSIEVAAIALSKTNLTPEIQANLMKKFSQKLPGSIERYAKAHKVSVVNAQVLVSQNYFDITSIVVKRTLDEVRHGK